MGKLTKAQASRMRYLAREHTGGRAVLSTSADHRVFAQLADLRLVTVVEIRPGFYAAHITDAGRAALREPT